MTVLVTGADGFIGSHLVEQLVRRNVEVKALTYYNSFNSWGWLDQVPQEILEGVQVVPGDVRDAESVREAVRGCSIIYHLAALIAIPYSYHAPRSYVDTNVVGTLNVLQAARDHDVERVVHTSTSEVYGTARFVPITEEHPLQGQSPYAASKIGADQLALSFQRSFGTPVALIRPFNTYGPRQSARAVIPTIITQVASGSRRVRLGALSPTRDFTYISDTVAGFLAVAHAEEAVGDVVNVGSGFEISIGDLARTVAEVMGEDVMIEQEADRMRPEESEVDRLLADIGKARRVAGWEPILRGEDGLREGLRRTVEWFTDPENLSFYKADVYNL